MMEKCFDEGTIQAFLDGELASDLSEKVACHAAACDGCAIMLAEAEEESAFAFSVLEEEFNTLVPTNRLWTKINDSIEGNKKPFWQIVFARFSSPSVAAFASLLIVAGLFTAFMSLKYEDDKNSVAAIVPDEQIATSPISQGNLLPSALIEPKANIAGSVKISASGDDKNKPRIIKGVFSEKENSRRQTEIQKSNSIINQNPKSPVEVESRSSDENLLGEESYIKTIATLEKTVDSRKDDVLRPSARFAFEKDLAVTDDAIKKMKAEVRKNPKNEAAKDVLRASYQNKIDLLNSVAEKTELMSSLIRK
jgi:hypothetical protein